MSENSGPPKDMLDWLGITDAPRWGVARPLGAAFAVVLILLFLAALASAGAVLFRTISGDTSVSLGAGALITALLGAPFLIWGTIIKQRTWETQKEGHITDRISKAVEQLGAEKTVKRLTEDGQTVETTEPNIEVRIGGLLSLERIAQDSIAYDKGRDHVRVMEILCAYVRENARAEHLIPTLNLAAAKTPRIDVQTAMNLIKRRSADQVAIEAAQKYRLDLRGCDFDGFDLSKGNFAGALMSDCRFEDTDLRYADMTGTRMFRSLLNRAWFAQTTLRGTRMECCEYTQADGVGLRYARLLGVFIEGANMPELSVTEKNSDDLYGPIETVIKPGDDSVNEEAKSEGLKAAKEIHRRKNSEGGSFDEEAFVSGLSQKAKMFIHWNPFEQGDIAAHGEERPKFCERKGLTGWPHED